MPLGPLTRFCAKKAEEKVDQKGEVPAEVEGKKVDDNKGEFIIRVLGKYQVKFPVAPPE